MSGIDIAEAAISQRAHYAMSFGTGTAYAASKICGAEIAYGTTTTICRTDIAYPASMMCGTEMAYAATRSAGRGRARGSGTLCYLPTRILRDVRY
eukprot:2887142-Rhodomonas_salina.1